MSKPKYLFDSLGTWIAFYQDANLFGLRGDWLGWIEPANQNRVFDIDGEYLGTIIKDRLLREVVPPTASNNHPGYPGRAIPPDHPGYPGQFELPFNMEDVGLAQYV